MIISDFSVLLRNFTMRLSTKWYDEFKQYLRES